MTSPLRRDRIDCYGFKFTAAAYKLPKSDLYASVSRERDGQGGNILRVMIRNDSAACQGLHFLSGCL